MRSLRFGRAISLAPILLTALASSGCPELNRQPDYLGEKNSLMSVADPLPAGQSGETASAAVFARGDVASSAQ